jgi:hypothetical protein
MNQTRNGRRGFIYSPHDAESPLNTGKAGDIIQLDSTPPWLVVDHSKQTIVMTNWPGKLWLAEVIEPASESDQPNDIYTRSRSVRLIEHATTAELFGENGRDVEKILDQAAGLQLNQLLSIKHMEPKLERLYSDAWNSWANDLHQGSSTDDHRYTLAMGTHGNESPIGKGLLLLSNVFHKLAQKLEGDAAFVVDDEGEIEFVPKWKLAFDAARHAAMAYGAPQCFSTDDQSKMATPWNTIVGAQ